MLGPLGCDVCQCLRSEVQPGELDFDQRHLLHISYIYELPLLRIFDAFLHAVDKEPGNDLSKPTDPNNSKQAWQANHVVRSFLGGWEVSGITLFESGIPFTVVNGGSPGGVSTLDNAGVANGTGSGSYPDLSGISAHSPKPVGGNNSGSVGPLLLNPAAFVAPRGLTFGNAGRNVLNNPRRWNTDAALAKHFAAPYGTNVEFRAEAFNIFNVTQFRIYDPVLGMQAENTASCYAPSRRLLLSSRWRRHQLPDGQLVSSSSRCTPSTHHSVRFEVELLSQDSKRDFYASTAADETG